MARYDADDIARFWVAAGKMGLEAPDEFYNAQPEFLATICNGVGGSGSWLTGLLTVIYRHYQASAAIHDVSYYFGSLSQLDADRMFRRNMLREWAYRYGRLRWVIAARERAKIELAYLTVRKHGEKHYGHILDKV